MQRRLAWPPRKDDAHDSRSVDKQAERHVRKRHVRRHPTVGSTQRGGLVKGGLAVYVLKASQIAKPPFTKPPFVNSRDKKGGMGRRGGRLPSCVEAPTCEMLNSSLKREVVVFPQFDSFEETRTSVYLEPSPFFHPTFLARLLRRPFPAAVAAGGTSVAALAVSTVASAANS